MADELGLGPMAAGVKVLAELGGGLVALGVAAEFVVALGPVLFAEAVIAHPQAESQTADSEPTEDQYGGEDSDEADDDEMDEEDEGGGELW